MTKTEAAMNLALRAHATQVRKTDNSPYVVHPLMVAHILAQYNVSEEVVVAALLHDVLEDTSISREELLAVSGDVSFAIIEAVSEKRELPWEERKEAYIQQVLQGGESVWLVSVGDKVHNAESLLDYIDHVGEAAWQAFNRGREAKLWFETSLYTELKKVWQHPLLDRYGALIAALQQS